MKRKLVGYYDYTVVLTYCGMLFAFMGILHSIGHEYWRALFCLMIAGVCDMFDGTVASTKDRDKNQKRFGIQIDSLSDLISFGVFPAIFVYMLLGGVSFVGIACAIYVLCALIRLAYYNVLEEERQAEATHKESSFIGVPVTTIAIILPAVYLLFDKNIIHNDKFFVVTLLLVAAGFIAPIEIKKPKPIGKVILIVLGVIEAAFMVFLVAWGAS